MTCIVGIVHEGEIHIGGDSAGAAGWAIEVRADSKVWAKAGYVFGFTTSFRMGQLLRHALELPAPPTYGGRADLERFMVLDFVNVVRDCLKAGGYARKEHEVEQGGDFLVGVRGRLFHVSSDYQVGETVNGYAAIGCGSDLALGALHALDDHYPPALRIQAALSAAEFHSAGVAGPFAVVAGGAR